MKIKCMATFTPEEKEIVYKITHMFANYDDNDWELLKQCFYDELYVDMDEWFEDLQKIHNYIQKHLENSASPL